MNIFLSDKFYRIFTIDYNLSDKYEPDPSFTDNLFYHYRNHAS